MTKPKIPKVVRETGSVLDKAGHKAYLVGGCVRDLYLGREPKDWDIATDALPEEIQKLFPESVYENAFGTVGVKTDSDDERLKIIEITTFRSEGRYTDKRHPDEVKFAKTIEDDLSRRDFTINAIAMDLADPKEKFIDPYGGEGDLRKKLVRTVREPRERFNEDALRLMRAVRFAVELGFDIDHPTLKAVKDQAGLLEMIAKERIRDEFVKIIMAARAAEGVILLEDTGLLQYIVPELREGIGCGQNKHHIYTVFEHNVRALNYTAEKKYSLVVRLAALLHDVGKPRSKRGDGPDSTFHGHEVVGARMAVKIMDRLRFGKEIADKVVHLVRYHLFYYNVGEVTESGVRRFLARVGPENVDDLLRVREADRIGSGVPKAFPYKLRHLLFMIEKVKRDPIEPKMLKLRGDGLMKLLGIPPSPKIGQILSVLLEEVLDDPKRNDIGYLESRAKELGALSDRELLALSRKARDAKDEFESGVEEGMKKKYYVK
ncbi:CCA tRNA nucleotidyltransferase [Patescibacteria group bacterium]|nr:CCA tRNA nucleotidyltransferase [Patescibacteria group bacterium]